MSYSNIKTAFYTVLALIAITVIAKVALIIHSGSAPDPMQILEIAVASFAVIAIVTVKAVQSCRLRRMARKSKADIVHEHELQSRLEDDIHLLQSRLDDALDQIDNINDAIQDAQPDPIQDAQPDHFIPVIASLNPVSGKIEPIYELPPCSSRANALVAATHSVQARQREGMPVHNPQVIIRDAFSIDPDTIV